MRGEVLSVSLGLLAAVFLTSGYGKLVRPFPAALAMVRFRVVRRVRPWHGVLLGAGEVALGLWLVSGLTPAISAAGALVLLGVFLLLVSTALLRGEHFSCACLGARGSPLSGVSLLRNGLLVGVATLAVWSALGVTAPPDPQIRVLGLAVGALTICISMTAAAVAELRVFSDAMTRSDGVPR